MSVLHELDTCFLSGICQQFWLQKKGDQEKKLVLSIMYLDEANDYFPLFCCCSTPPHFLH